MIARRNRLLVAVAAGMALSTLAGCSTDSGEPEETATSVYLGQDHGEWQRNMQQCLRDHGFEVTIGGDGSIGHRGSSEQADAYNTALGECRGQYDEEPLPELTEPELRLVYVMTQKTVQCLIDHGQDPGKVPSEQAFIDSRGWDPYSEIWYPGTSLSEEEYYALLEACPRPSQQEQ